MSRAADALRAIERAQSLGIETAGSKAALEILAELEAALENPGDALAQDGEWAAHEDARRQLPTIKKLRAQVSA